MKKKRIAIILILLFILCQLCACGGQSPKLRKKITTVVKENEEVLIKVIEELNNYQNLNPEISYISSTFKKSIDDPKYSDIVGLYFCIINVDEDNIYVSLENKALEEIMCIENLKKISISDSCYIFDFGGLGIAPSSIDYGFYYSAVEDGEKALLEQRIRSVGGEITAEGKGWKWVYPLSGDRMYVEKIVDNFYYYDETF